MQITIEEACRHNQCQEIDFFEVPIMPLEHPPPRAGEADDCPYIP